MSVRRPPSAVHRARTVPRENSLTARQYVTPSQRAPDPELSTTGAATDVCCLDSKAPDSRTRSVVCQPALVTSVNPESAGARHHSPSYLGMYVRPFRGSASCPAAARGLNLSRRQESNNQLRGVQENLLVYACERCLGVRRCSAIGGASLSAARPHRFTSGALRSRARVIERDMRIGAEQCREHGNGEIDASEPDESVDDPSDDVGRAEALAKEFGDEIPLEQGNEAPIERSDDDKK